jgi:hypothetical protein
LIQDVSEIVPGESHLNERDFLTDFWEFNGMGVDDGDFIKFEVPLNQWQGSLPYRAMSHYANVVNVSVNLMLLLHKSLNSL